MESLLYHSYKYRIDESKKPVYKHNIVELCIFIAACFVPRTKVKLLVHNKKIYPFMRVGQRKKHKTCLYRII